MLLIALLVGPPGHLAAEAQSASVLIADFESGVQGWRTNDGLAEQRGKPMIAEIYGVSPGAPDGGGQAALIEFDAGQKTWASVTVSVDGSAWVDRGSTGISLWLRGDGGRHEVDLVLRSYLKVGQTTTDTSYIRTISLTSADWFNLGAPFASFRNDKGAPIDEAHLTGVKLFQFVKTGSWQPLRFTVDQIRAEELPAPIQPEPVAGARVVDFDAGGEACRLQHGVCFGSQAMEQLRDAAFAARVRSSLALLGRSVVRVRLSDFYLRDLEQVNTIGLQTALSWIRSSGCDPLLCFDEPLPVSGVSPEKGWRDFGALCARLAVLRRAEPGVHYYEIGNEPLLAGHFRTIEAATAAYNALAAQTMLADPRGRVGGMGFASPWDENLRYFTEHARTLHFLSFHFYGAHSPVAGDDELFDVACQGKAEDLPHQVGPAGIRAMVDERRGVDVEVWITECAVNSAREANGRARDARIRTHYGAAWVGAFSLAVAPYVDRVLWFKAFGHGWGLLTDGGEATPAFAAAALMSRVAPAGATVGQPMPVGASGVVAAVSSSSGRYTVLAHAAPSSTVELHLGGTPPVEPVRIRRIDPASPSAGFEPMAPSPIQRLTSPGPGLAVIEAPHGQ